MSGWLAAFIVIAAVAIVVQMAILLGMFIQVRVAVQHLTRITTDLQARVDPILLRTNRILENSEDRITSIMGDAAEVTRLARGQAQKVDRVFTEATERLRVQLNRADQILTGTLEVLDEAGSTFRRRLWKPLNQASAVIKGVMAGLEFLRSQRRPAQRESATQDEELFI
jgi:hypothetical protein